MSKINFTGTVFDEDYTERFQWPEYLVFGALLSASLGIGVFYGCFGKKNKTSEDFLMAGRSMPVFPVTLSLLCSYVSAVTLLGNPAEVYFYGLQYTFMLVNFIWMTLSLSYLYVPVYCKLRLTSAYEYFEKRFDRRLRVVISMSQIIHALLYMPLTTWGPAIALEEVAGINARLTAAIIFLVCICYSSLGGLKAVLWTDALQAIVIYVSLISVIIIGVNEVGGMDIVWQRAEYTGRTNILNFDTDLRTRHTFWSAIIGAYFAWIPLFAATQAQIQRYLSVPTLRHARQVIWINMVALMLVVCMCSTIGLIIYAKYYQCDPITLGKISNSDQLLPLFVMDIIGNIPVIPGLFVAALTAGSLSSVSSSLNALAAIITEDFIKKYKPNLSDTRLSYLSKTISTICGLISFALIFVIAEVGNILPFASLLHGAFIGPIFGCFTLGMFFPWTNWLGVILSLFPSIGLTVFIGIGHILTGNAKKLPNQRLFLDISGCYVNSTTSSPVSTTPAFLYNKELLISSAADSMRSNTAWKDQEYSALTKLFSLSYSWQPVIPAMSVIILGIIFSFIAARFKSYPKVEAKYFSPPLLTLWCKLLGNNRLSNYVEFDYEDLDKNEIKDSGSAIIHEVLNINSKSSNL